jgi:hypothetical protein
MAARGDAVPPPNTRSNTPPNTLLNTPPIVSQPLLDESIRQLMNLAPTTHQRIDLVSDHPSCY